MRADFRAAKSALWSSLDKLHINFGTFVLDSIKLKINPGVAALHAPAVMACYCSRNNNKSHLTIFRIDRFANPSLRFRYSALGITLTTPKRIDSKAANTTHEQQDCAVF